MRSLHPRPQIPNTVLVRLAEKTKEITAILDKDGRKKRAAEIFEASRKTQWFAPVVAALQSMCGPGGLCMYCSSNEPSQVEHYRPCSVFPEVALAYENYIWSCDICNRSKGDRFPPETEIGENILNPIVDNVWDYFFIDEQFGRLIARVDPATGATAARAMSTRAVVQIDRENVQTKRQHRYRRLRKDVQDALDKFKAGVLTKNDLDAELTEQRLLPFQADVADYFLNGPGKNYEPFKSALDAIK